MFKEKTIDLNTNEEILTEYNADQLLELQKAQAVAAARIAEEANKKAARKAIFDKLGLTEEEAKLLLS